MASVRRVKGYWSSELCELEAAMYDVEMVVRLGYSHIILEGDTSLC